MPNTINFARATKAWDLLWDVDWVTAVQYIGSTRKVAAGNRRGQLLLWDLPEQPGGDAPRPVRQLNGHTNAITRLQCTADGRWLISTGFDHTIRYWDMQADTSENAAVVLNVGAREEAERRNRSLPDAVSVDVGVQSSSRTLQGHEDWIQSMCLSHDNTMLISGDDLGRINVWDRASGNQRNRWQVEGWVNALALTRDNQKLLVAERVRQVFSSDRYQSVKIRNPSNGETIRDLSNHFSRLEIRAAAFSPDGSLLALGQGGEISGTAKVFLFDPATGRKLREINTHRYGVTDLAFSPDGAQLLSCGRDTTVRVWNPSNGREVKQIGTPRGGQFKDWIHSFSLSADGRWLAAADMSGLVQIWHLPT